MFVKKFGEKIGVYDWKLKKKWKSCEKTRTNKKKSFQPPYNSRVKLTNFLSGRVFIIFHVQSQNWKICEKVIIFFSKIFLFHEIVYTLLRRVDWAQFDIKEMNLAWENLRKLRENRISVLYRYLLWFRESCPYQASACQCIPRFVNSCIG